MSLRHTFFYAGGSGTVTPAAIVCSADTGNPTVVLGGVAVAPAVSAAVAATIDPVVASALSVFPAAVEAGASVVTPNVLWAFIPSGPWVITTTVVGKTLTTIVRRLERRATIIQTRGQAITAADVQRTIVRHRDLSTTVRQGQNRHVVVQRINKTTLH